MIVRLNRSAHLESINNKLGVEGDLGSSTGKMSEVDKILEGAIRKVQEGGVPGVGISGSNSGKGHDPKASSESLDANKRVSMERVVEEEPSLTHGDATNEIAPEAGVGGSAKT